MGYYLRSQIARDAGVTMETLRFYERKGLIQPARGHNGYRWYSEATLDRLRFINRAKGAGFTLDEIKQTLDLFACGMDFAALSTVMTEGIEQKIEEVERRMDNLTQVLSFLREIRQALRESRICPSLEPFIMNPAQQ
jgi:DNA-binding transcriptional MerR regulator